MRKYISGAVILFSAAVLSGCISTSVRISPDGNTKITSVGITGCGNPSQRITRVETKGKADITFGSTGSDPCNVVIGSAINAGGQVLAAHVLPGSNISVSSGSVNETNTNVDIETN